PRTLHASCAGSTRASIENAFLEDGLIAGSSPAMTADGSRQRPLAREPLGRPSSRALLRRRKPRRPPGLRPALERLVDALREGGAGNAAHLEARRGELRLDRCV